MASSITRPSTIPTYVGRGGSDPLGLKPMYLHFQPLPSKKPLIYVIRAKRASVRSTMWSCHECNLLSGREDPTVRRQSSTITVAPIQGKEKSPDLDDGGTRLPPRDDSDGGGGGGGGGGHRREDSSSSAFLYSLRLLEGPRK